MRVLGLDIGSSSVKAGVWDSVRGKALSRVRAAYPTHFEGARVEISAEHLLKAVRRAGREAVKGTGRVDAVAYCAFSSGVVVTDASGKARTPIITHADRRSVDVARELVKGAGRNGERWWLERIGNLPYPGGIGASTLAWLRRQERGVFRGEYRAGQVSSLVGRWLTGRWVIDPSQAAFLGLWDIRRERWNEEVCAAVGVKAEALPELMWADERMGGLVPAVAREWGLAAGVPVVGGLVDTSAAVLQTPMGAGQLVHNAGSTDVLAMCLDVPRPAVGVLTRPVGAGRVLEKKWLAVRTIAASGSAMAWVRETMFGELSEAAWGRVSARACARDGRGDLEVSCVPAFAGERAAIEQRAGAEFKGLHLGTGREEMLAAVVRGLVAASGENFGILRRLHQVQGRVYAMGGAGELGEAMHRAWRRMGGKGLRFVGLSGDALPGLARLAACGLE